MKEDTSEFKIDHRNGPDPEVEKALEQASMPEKTEHNDESSEAVTISAKEGLEVEATEAKATEDEKTDKKPAAKEAENRPKAQNSANYWLPRAVIFLILAFVLVIAIMAICSRYK